MERRRKVIPCIKKENNCETLWAEGACLQAKFLQRQHAQYVHASFTKSRQFSSESSGTEEVHIRVQNLMSFFAMAKK